MSGWRVVFASFLLLGCGKKNEPPAPAEEPPAAEAPARKPCTEDRDCPRGWVCLAKECADTSHSGFYKHPENAVTPAKVKKHAEQIGAEREQRNEAVFDKETSPNSNPD
jgi:hypothetical protein